MLIGKKLRGFQLSPEVTQGTLVAANRLIPNGTFSGAKRKNSVKIADAEGHRAGIGVQRGKRWSEWSCNGALGYNVMSYWAQGMFDASVSPTNPATGAYVYVYQDLNGTLHTPQTYSFEYGNSLGENSKFAFGTLSDLTLKIDEANCTYEVGGFGAYPTKNISMTATPTRIAPNLVSFTDCRLSLATAFGSISSGKLVTAKSIEISIKNRFKAAFFIDDATISFGGILELMPTISGKIIVAEGTESDQFLSALEASTLVYLQLKATGPLIIAGSPNYFNTIQYTWACFIEEEEESDTDDLFTGTYTFKSAEDVTNGDVNLSITNTIATL